MSTVCACHDNRSKRRRFAALFALLLALVVGCVPGQPPKILQAVTDTVPPCWHEICPGLTSRQEVLQILDSLPEVGKDNVWELTIDSPASGTGWQSERFSGPDLDFGKCVYQDDVVGYCYFSYRGSGLKLRYVIEEFGSPEYIVPVVEYSDRREIRVILAYPDIGFATAYMVTPWLSNEIKVSPNQKIRYYYLFAPEFYEQLLGEPYGLLDVSRETAQTGQRPWPGYGTFEVDVP